MITVYFIDGPEMGTKRVFDADVERSDEHGQDIIVSREPYISHRLFLAWAKENCIHMIEKTTYNYFRCSLREKIKYGTEFIAKMEDQVVEVME